MRSQKKQRLSRGDLHQTIFAAVPQPNESFPRPSRAGSITRGIFLFVDLSDELLQRCTNRRILIVTEEFAALFVWRVEHLCPAIVCPDVDFLGSDQQARLESELAHRASFRCDSGFFVDTQQTGDHSTKTRTARCGACRLGIPCPVANRVPAASLLAWPP